MITRENQLFVLNTKHTTYAFQVTPTGHLEHLHYGRKIRIDEQTAIALTEKRQFAPGNGNYYNDVNKHFSLEDVRLEMSSYGKGDIREPFIEVVHADGSFTSDFLFEKAEIITGKDEFETLPGSYDESGKVDHLLVTLVDKHYNLTMELHYYVYEECDVITRSTKLINTSGKDVELKRLMSMQLDFDASDFVMTTFTGEWVREMKRSRVQVSTGKFVNSTYAGASSSRANPFFMLGKEHTSEDAGECYGFNLIYSGNHYECVEVSGYGKTRVITGVNPQSFSWKMEPGGTFEAPEAVMTYSHEGYNGMSQHMHAFVREHIVRGEWKYKARPVLLNSWEAAYFKINEHKLLSLARAGKELGIELFVMDDGWFGTRNDDTQALGDWEVNTKKLPGGVKRLAEKVRALGMDFGIWVEPEMVNVNSNLYRNHPEWALGIPGKPHAEGRNQRILDLTNPQVQDYVIEAMTNIFSSAEISYVKWDMNRIFSDVYSQTLAVHMQGEVFHRYIIGLYRVMKTLTERFPHILFEGCASGGNRFDLGILSYFPQIWASDDSDAICRAEIQNGYSYGYPMSTVTAHVSACPNHQTLRHTPLATRYNVALFGVLGYECNFCEMTKEELDAVKKQIAQYKAWRDVLQYGSFYRGRSFEGEVSALRNGAGNITEWTCVSKDKEKAVGMIVQKLAVPNTSAEMYRAKGLEEEMKYHFYSESSKYNIKHFGGLVNMISPIHIKQHTLLEEVASRVVKLDDATEDCMVYGDTLMYSGVRLKQAFSSTGFNNETRFFQDFSSRLFFMEKE